VAQVTVGGAPFGAWSGIALEDGASGTTNAWPGPDPMPADFTVTMDCESSGGLVQRMIEVTTILP
jgi:hypothetical protein